jgi:hypothetical protein
VQPLPDAEGTGPDVAMDAAEVGPSEPMPSSVFEEPTLAESDSDDAPMVRFRPEITRLEITRNHRYSGVLGTGTLNRSPGIVHTRML